MPQFFAASLFLGVLAMEVLKRLSYSFPEDASWQVVLEILLGVVKLLKKHEMRLTILIAPAKMSQANEIHIICLPILRKITSPSRWRC